jgi:hypothetical protein
MTEHFLALAALCKNPILTKDYVSSRFGFDVKVMRKILSLLVEILADWLKAISLT